MGSVLFLFAIGILVCLSVNDLLNSIQIAFNL